MSLKGKIEEEEKGVLSGFFRSRFLRKMVLPFTFPFLMGGGLIGCGDKPNAPEEPLNKPPDTEIEIVSAKQAFFSREKTITIENGDNDIHLIYKGSDEDGYVKNFQASIFSGDLKKIIIDWFTVDYQRYRIPGLDAGDYILQVRAVDDDRAIDPTPASVAFSIDRQNKAPETYAEIVDKDKVASGWNKLTLEGRNRSKIFVAYKGEDDRAVKDFEVDLKGPLRINRKLSELRANTISGLPSGNYILKISAIDDENAKDESPALVDFSIEKLKNKVVLPASLQNLDFKIFEILRLGGSTVPENDGSYSGDYTGIKKSEVVILSAGGYPVLLGYARQGDENVEISSKSTIVALAMMNPYLMGSSAEDRKKISDEIWESEKLEDIVRKSSSFLGWVSLDSDISKQIHEEALSLSNEVLGVGVSSGKRIGDKNNPHLDDGNGDVVEFVNPKCIYYGLEVIDMSTSFSRFWDLLEPRPGLFDLSLRPPNILANPSVLRVSGFGDGSFRVKMYKGFQVENIVELLDLNNIKGRATIANVGYGIINLLDLVGAPLSMDFNELRLKDSQNLKNLYRSIKEGEYEEAVVNTAKVMQENADVIGRAIWAEVGDDVVDYLRTLSPIFENVFVALKLGKAADKVPIFWDLVFGPGEVNYEVTQWKNELREFREGDLELQPNKAPNKPYVVYPEDGTTNIPLELRLDWECSDPDGDKLTYKIYFEAWDNTPDEVLRSETLISAVDIKNLEYNTTYYWEVEVSDGYKKSFSGVWKFTTKKKEVVPPPSPPGETEGKIVFVSNMDRESVYGISRDYDIHIMNSNGSGIIRMTNTGAEEESPVWSPDGREIAFSKGVTIEKEIYVINADGSGETRLTNNSFEDKDPAWSPDGRKIAFGSYRNHIYGLYIMDSNGTNLRKLIDDNDLGTSYLWTANPAWSPDGKKIAFESRDIRDWHQIYTINTDGTGLTKLTDSEINIYPSWSPDGRKIAFVSKRDGNYEIYIMDSNGDNETRLTYNSAIDRCPSWAPDSKKIVYESDRDIWIMNSDGSNKVNLTKSPNFLDIDPDWSPY